MGKRLATTVRCEICYSRYKSLAGHFKVHGLNVRSYKKLYPESDTVSPQTRRRLQLARFRAIYKKKGKLSPKIPRGMKVALTSRGRKHSAETKEKIRQSMLGMKLSESHKLAISAGMQGHFVSEKTREKLRNVKITKERRRNMSEAQLAEKGSAWKGGCSRHLYFGKGKYRLKKIFGEPLRCFYPGCDKVEGKNVRSLDCHHLDGNHENNPMDGSNWLPLCRSHHMLVDGRLKGRTAEETTKANETIRQIHTDYMKDNYVGEVKSYYE